MALGIAEPEAPKREDEIDKRISGSFDPETRTKLEAVRDRNQEDVSLARGLKDAEDGAGGFASTSKGGNDVQNQEENPSWDSNVTPRDPKSTTRGRLRSFFASKKKAASATILAGVATGLIGFGFFGLALGPIAAIQNATLDLSDPLSAATERAEELMEYKIFKKAMGGGNDGFAVGCGGITGKLPIKCRYGVATKKLTDKLANVGIEVIETSKHGPFEIPEKFRVNGEVFDAAGLREYLNSNPLEKMRYKQGINSNWLMMKGVAYIRGVLPKFNVTESPPRLEGTVDEQANELKGGNTKTTVSELDTSKLVPALDENGKLMYDEAGRQYYSIETGLGYPADGSGGIFTKTDPNILITLEEIRGIEARVNLDIPDESSRKNPISAMKPSAGNLALMSANVLGTTEAACTANNMVKHASIAAKVYNKRDLIKYALPIASAVGAIHAGNDLTNEQVEAVMKFFYDSDNREFISGYTNIGGGEYEFSEKVKNPDYGKNLLDSDLFHMSAGSGIASPSVVTRTYATGFGAESILRSMSKYIGITGAVLTTVLTAGKDCGRDTMFVARWGGLAITATATVASIIAAAPTGGASLAALSAGAAKAAVQFAVFAGIFAAIDNWADRYFSNSIINETMAGSPLERGAAVWTGLASLHSEHAQQRGMMPGNTDQILAYQTKQNVARQEIIALERQNSSFFDINNQYSVTGSVALAVNNSIPTSLSNSTLASLPTILSSFVFDGVASALSPYRAAAASLDATRYEQCDDEQYNNLGINADVQCNVRFVMPPESMRWDPLDTAQWMETEGYVKENTTTGYPESYTPPDQRKAQSFIEELALGAVNDYYHTRKYGDTDKEREYGKFLDFCVYRSNPFGETYEDQGAFNSPGENWVNGKNCLITKEGDHGASAEFAEKINRFRAYVFDMSVNDDLDESPIIENINCGPFGGNTGGSVGTKMTEQQLREQIASYGLPEPDENVSAYTRSYDIMYGEQTLGWKEMLENLQSNPKAAWAAQALLNGEKKWKAAGGEVKEYLNTAWMWFETDQTLWPDPYEMNCVNNTNVTASHFCSSTNFQVAGYQPGDVRSKFKDVYDKLYSENELTSIMQAVVQNSTNAAKDAWNYNDPSNLGKAGYFNNLDNVTFNDLWPNKDFGDEKAQIQSLILGKDPNMAAALNSFAVSDSDVVAHLGTGDGQGPGWGHYIRKGHRQAISNMMMALYMFDGQGPAGGANCTTSSGVSDGSALPGWVITTDPNSEMDYRVGEGVEPLIRFRHAMLDNKSTDFNVSQLHGPGNSQFAMDNRYSMYGGYDFPSYGFETVGHPGYDIAMPLGTKLYAGVEGTVVTAGASGYFYHTAATKNSGGMGELRIQLANGDEVILGHMQSITVKVGETVSAGTYVGESGYADGPHLHLEYRKKNSSSGPTCSSGFCIVDPTHYIP